MAFIPDDAQPLMLQAKLSPNARMVFQAHCKFRRHKYRVSFATNEEVAVYLGISLGSVRNATTELKRKGWIAQVAHYTEMLVGDFSEVDKNHPQREIPAGPLFRRPVRAGAPDAHETVNRNHESVNPNHETMISNHETVNGNHESVNGAYIGSRARSDQPMPATTSTHTSHAPAREGPPAKAAPADAGGVCVSMPKSRYGKEQCIEWAEDRKAKGGRITDAHAVGRARWLDGSEDDEIGKFLARRGQVLEGKRPVEQQLTPYHVAAQAVASVASVPGYDVAAYIAQMPGVSEETRSKLRRTFIEQARAHAPP
jgi:hypothetical protein